MIMKHTLALVLMVFGIVGCATNSDLPENTSETSLESGRFTYYLKSSYPSGFNRICIYKNGASDFTETIDGIKVCENSIER